jgi:hypothetical protein
MSGPFIFAQDVSFNQTLINVTQILPVFTTDTITNISCTRLNFSGTLVASNMSCANTVNANTIGLGIINTNPSITIFNPLVPTYGYTLTNGTNVEGTIGYIYSKTVTFTTTIVPNSDTNLIGNFNTGISIKGGIYVAKLDIAYRNTFGLPSTTPVKIQHGINTEVFQNVMYFNNSTNEYRYSNTCILFIGTGQLISHNCFLPQFLSGISNINVSIVNSQYTLSLLKIG